MNKQERRSRERIIYDLLKSIENLGGEVIQTKLMVKTNLPHILFKRCVDELIKNQMISEKSKWNKDTEHKYYLTLDKGFIYVSKYEELMKGLDGGN